MGLEGIEQYYDSYLKGENGGDLIEVNSSGKTVGFLGKRLAQRGNDIHLTIDSRMQKIAYRTLKRRKGVIILIEANSGEILSDTFVKSA